MTGAVSKRTFCGLTALALLGACGKAGSLDRTADMAPQPIAYGAQAPESVGELIEPSVQAAPGRTGSFINASRVRKYSEFDIPPGVEGVPFPGDPITADFDDAGDESQEVGDDGA